MHPLIVVVAGVVTSLKEEDTPRPPPIAQPLLLPPVGKEEGSEAEVEAEGVSEVGAGVVAMAHSGRHPRT